VFVADVTAMREPYPLLAVNTATRERCLDDEDYAHEMRHGREYRLLPAGVGDVIGNVSLANMDFPEFAAWAKTAPSGYFRGAGADRT
jgi:hypothetical protein